MDYELSPHVGTITLVGMALVCVFITGMCIGGQLGYQDGCLDTLKESAVKGAKR